MHRIREYVPLGSLVDDGRLACGYDVRLKLFVALATVLAVVLSSRLALSLLVLAGCLAWLVASRAPLGTVLARLIAPLGLALAIGVMRTFLTGTTPLATWDLGLCRLTATREGLAEGTLIGCRVLASVAVVVCLCLRTPALDILAALRWARMPQTLIEIAHLMYRYVFVLFEQAINIASAQKVRLGYISWSRSIRSLGTLSGMVLLRSLDQAERSYEAMLARGYRGTLATPTLPALPRRQAAVACLCVALVWTGYAVTEHWPFPWDRLPACQYSAGTRQAGSLAHVRRCGRSPDRATGLSEGHRISWRPSVGRFGGVRDPRRAPHPGDLRSNVSAGSETRAERSRGGPDER
jgi:cobalt/nickel transport system permease protein